MVVTWLGGYDLEENLLDKAITIEKSCEKFATLYLGIEDEDEAVSRVYMTTDQTKQLLIGLLTQLKDADPTVDDAFLKELANI